MSVLQRWTQIVCVNIDESKVEMMKAGNSPIYEADLVDLMRKNYTIARITYTIDYRSAYKDADVIFLGVGTPEQPDGSANLSYIATVARQVVETIEKDSLIISV